MTCPCEHYDKYWCEAVQRILTKLKEAGVERSCPMEGEKEDE